MRLPKYLKKYFWDVDFEKLDAERYPGNVITRILEYGDKRSATWMFRHFNREEIRNIIKNSRQISRKSANFWAIYLGINKSEVKCLSKEFQKIQRAIWPY